MFLLTAENIDYVAITDEPNQPSEDATDVEREKYVNELKVWTKDNKRAWIFILGSMTDSLYLVPPSVGVENSPQIS